MTGIKKIPKLHIMLLFTTTCKFNLFKFIQTLITYYRTDQTQKPPKFNPNRNLEINKQPEIEIKKPERLELKKCMVKINLH